MSNVTCGKCGRRFDVRYAVPGEVVSCPQCQPTAPTTAPPFIPDNSLSQPELHAGSSPSVRRTRSRRAPKRKQPVGLYIALWLLAGLVAGCAVFGLLLNESSSPQLVLTAVPDQRISENQRITITLRPQGVASQERVAFSLREGPQGAMLDQSTGRFTWTPSEQQGNRDFRAVIDARIGGRAGQVAFNIRVDDVHRRPIFAPVGSQLAKMGSLVRVHLHAKDADIPAASLRYELSEDAPADATLDAETGELTWTPPKEFGNTTVSIPIKAIETSGGVRRQRCRFRSQYRQRKGRLTMHQQME